MSKVGDVAKLLKIFEKYAGGMQFDLFKLYLSDGADSGILDLGKFFDDAKLDGSGIAGFVLAWKVDSKALGTITKDEFVNKFSEFGVDTFAAITTFLKNEVSSLNDIAVFKEMYKWVFKYLKGPGQKRTIDKTELLFAIWPILIDSKKFTLFEPFLEFFKNHKDGSVSLDLWMMTFELVSTHENGDLSNYDASGGWPSLLDQFVDSLKKSQNK